MRVTTWRSLLALALSANPAPVSPQESPGAPVRDASDSMTQASQVCPGGIERLPVCRGPTRALQIAVRDERSLFMAAAVGAARVSRIPLRKYKREGTSGVDALHGDSPRDWGEQAPMTTMDPGSRESSPTRCERSCESHLAAREKCDGYSADQQALIVRQ